MRHTCTHAFILDIKNIPSTVPVASVHNLKTNRRRAADRRLNTWTRWTRWKTGFPRFATRRVAGRIRGQCIFQRRWHFLPYCFDRFADVQIGSHRRNITWKFPRLLELNVAPRKRLFVSRAKGRRRRSNERRQSGNHNRYYNKSYLYRGRYIVKQRYFHEIYTQSYIDPRESIGEHYYVQHNHGSVHDVLCSKQFADNAFFFFLHFSQIWHVVHLFVYYFLFCFFLFNFPAFPLRSRSTIRPIVNSLVSIDFLSQLLATRRDKSI